MDANRKFWNEQQQELNRALKRVTDPQKVKELFLAQHAMLHSRDVDGASWSFADEVWDRLSESQARCLPPGGEHSLAWILWHIARIEDIVMNILVADAEQVLLQNDWRKRLGVNFCDSGNTMNTPSIVAFSAAVDLPALQAYRSAVGRRTREIIQELDTRDFSETVQPDRLQRVRDEGAVDPAAGEIIAYWGGKTIGGLLLMPPTRHVVLHLNEALRIKKALARI